MTIEESYESIGDDLDCLTDWMEHLEGKSLDELREIRKALGRDVEASERDFLEMLHTFTTNLPLPRLSRSGKRLDNPNSGNA